MSLDELLVSLRKECGATASAVVSRDGLIVASDLPPEVSQETFSIMCAAIMGAGLTAITELGKSSPTHITLDSEDIRLALYAAGRKMMVAIVLPPDADMKAVRRSAELIAKQVAQA